MFLVINAGMMAQPKLALGTTNPGKISALHRALTSYPVLQRCPVSSHKVASGVADQPMSLEETTQGAKNRAVAAAAAENSGSVLGVGIESGLFLAEGKLFDVCCCVIWDGLQHHIGFSCAWELPESVRKKVTDGRMDLSKAFQHISADPNIGEKGGAIAVMTGGRVTRPDYTQQAIQMAITSLQPHHYTCAPVVPQDINDDFSAARAAAEMFDWSCGFILGACAGVAATVAIGRALR